MTKGSTGAAAGGGALYGLGTVINGVTIERWLRHPQAVRGDGDAIAVAETLLADEDDEDHLAA